MKLKIRQDKATHKIDVPDTITYKELKEKIGSFVGTEPSGVRLSLNKQVRIQDANQLCSRTPFNLSEYNVH